jgi:hypothetical protein
MVRPVSGTAAFKWGGGVGVESPRDDAPTLRAETAPIGVMTQGPLWCPLAVFAAATHSSRFTSKPVKADRVLRLSCLACREGEHLGALAV